MGARLFLILCAPLLLASCLLTPGPFTSSLDIRADRGFTFTYVGEANLFDPAGATNEGLSGALGGEDKARKPATDGKPKIETEDTKAKRRAVAEALAREVGYRSVEYLGNDKYRIDYSYTGKLDRSFVFPFNPDAEAIFPWLAIEVRKDGTARIRASAFGEELSGAPTGTPSDDGAVKDRRGTFTLTTDATLVMQNNEEGMAPGPGTRVVWKITPATKTVPTAVVRFTN